MTATIALLRGINVGGHRKVAMADLRDLFEALGHTAVSTYIQSGNVVFELRPSSSSADVAAEVESALRERLEIDTTVIVRMADQMVAALGVSADLFGDVDPATAGIWFAAPGMADDLVLDAARFAPDACVLVGNEVHVHCPNGFGRSKLTNQWVERQLGVQATMRNLKTVRRLLDMASELD